MTKTKRSTAFYINGGIGRVICAIPALEKYSKLNPDDDFIIFSEFQYEAFSGHPILHSRSYPTNSPHLFRDKLKDRNVVIPEPYAVWEYYNQKCSIAQAFDIIINGKLDKDLGKPNIILSIDELVTARSMIDDMRSQRGTPLFIFQPFGRGITMQAIQSPSGPIDTSGKSFTIEGAAKLIKLIEHKYSILMMNEFNVEFKNFGVKNDVFFVEDVNLRKWFGLLHECDAFIGCDSIGQHIANIYDKPTYLALGSTYPENVTYPDNKNFTIFDFNKDNRVYSPIRITVDEYPDRQNEQAMTLTDEQIEEIANKILNDI
ncbi:hypothetical protein N9827_00765 [bacterium]|nr:hypothetical protein [bacterium]|tara:strand:- start:7885 stop:8832 length:948 start_codon:yes stop_codon:yes gene_type:complete